jgi:feruloyl esterase
MLETGLRRRSGALLQRHGVIASLLAAACGTALAADPDCAALAAVTTADATISAATVVPTGAVVSGQTLSVAMCRVQGVARPSSDSEIKFEVWLPATAPAWTGRMKVNGTGGYAGAIPYSRLAQDIGDGFVTAGSNMGHDGGMTAEWTLGRPEKVKDWGLRAHFSVATAAKALAAGYFGEPVRHSYFEGCSNGGRQALLVAQNYPELFDGIVAGAPSNFYPDLLMWLLWTGKTLTPTVAFGPPSVSPDKRLAVTQRAVQACDAADGVTDGQIRNPRRCNFDIDTMGPAGDGTLSAEELKVFKAMYAGTTSETGVQRYTGARLGSENDWSPLFADNGGYGPFIGHYVYGVTSPPFDWRVDIDYSGVYDEVKTALTPITAAPSPDLAAFRSRGGKIIQTHGWNDSVVPPDGSIGYFHALTQWEQMKAWSDRAVDRRIGRLDTQLVSRVSRVYGDRVREFHRLFMMPSVGHCGGSTGPSAIGGGMPEPPKALRSAETHAVSAVIRWVEQGLAPERLVATRLDASGVIVSQRPLCPYPQEPVYRSGDVNSAASYVCRTPSLDVFVEPGDLIHVRNALQQRKLILPDR